MVYIAITVTEIAAGRVMLPDGRVRKMFSCTAANDTADLSAYFDHIYYCRCYVIADGTDAEAFVTTSATYDAALTLTGTATGAAYLFCEGEEVGSTGGST